MPNPYNIDSINGFLPGTPPLQSLPAQFNNWEQLAAEFSQLLNAGIFRSRAESMPVIDDISALKSPLELERAMLLLSCFGHGFVWQGYESAGYVPESIAIPWTRVAERLGRPPTLAHASLVLHNWKLLDTKGPVRLGNLGTLIQFHGGLDESWFYLVTTEIEATGAGVLGEFEPIETALGTNDFEQVERRLITVQQQLIQLNSILNRMYEHCDPYIFYNRIRPFLASFEGVEYRGCSEIPRHYFGGSAAQSSLLQAIDAMLGIAHGERHARSYLIEMRKYMPQQHAAYIAVLEARAPLADRIAAHCGSTRARRDCIQALTDFRQSHLEMVARYVSSQSTQTGPGHTGTGGTDPMIFLKQVTKDTDNSI